MTALAHAPTHPADTDVDVAARPAAASAPRLAPRLAGAAVVGLVIGLVMSSLHTGLLNGLDFWVELMFISTGFTIAAGMFLLIGATATRHGWGE